MVTPSYYIVTLHIHMHIYIESTVFTSVPPHTELMPHALLQCSLYKDFSLVWDLWVVCATPRRKARDTRL